MELSCFGRMALKDKNNGEKYIERKAANLTKIFDETYTQLIGQLERESGTLWQKNRARMMMQQVEKAIERLEKHVEEFTKDELQTTYLAFAREAKKDLEKQGVNVDARFGQVNTAALAAYSDDTKFKFASAMTGIRNSVQKRISEETKEAIRLQIAAGSAIGTDPKEIAKALQAQLEGEGLTALIDKGGSRWQLDRYANMLAKQQLGDMSRDSTRNTAVEYGFDVVEITSHNSKHEACAKWEGKRLSLTGKTKGIPTLEEAKASGLFHVGCLHGYFVVTELDLTPEEKVQHGMNQVQRFAEEAGVEVELVDYSQSSVSGYVYTKSKYVDGKLVAGSGEKFRFSDHGTGVFRASTEQQFMIGDDKLSQKVESVFFPERFGTKVVGWMDSASQTVEIAGEERNEFVQNDIKYVFSGRERVSKKGKTLRSFQQFLPIYEKYRK